MKIYQKFGQDAQALRCALQLHRPDTIKKIFYASGNDPAVQKQLAFLLARQQVRLLLLAAFSLLFPASLYYEVHATGIFP